MVTPTRRSPAVSMAQPYQRTERVTRRPQHPFNVQTMPFLITPIGIAPVLPGETLTHLLLQAQTWSDPLHATMKNTGWWNEYQFWYVKHRDMPGWEIAADGLGHDLIDMFVTNESLASHALASASPKWGAAKGGVNFVASAMQRIIDEYFRDEGESAATFTYGGGRVGLAGYYKAQIYGTGRDDAFQKLTLAANYQDHRQKLDIDGDGNIYIGDEMSRAYQEWAVMHDSGMIEMTYEDWMRTYGGRSDHGTEPDRVDQHRPELIANTRDFTYPTNTVEPSTGVAAVAVGWRTAEQVRKQFRFEEPGWIIGTQVIRPKMYLGNQAGGVASMMITRDSWLPPVRNAESTVGHATIAEDMGPLESIMAAPYMIDFRDLFLYGEQFVNYSVSGSTPMFAGLPDATGARRYVPDTGIDNLFAAPTTGLFRSDGMISLSIKGRQQEDTKNLILYRA